MQLPPEISAEIQQRIDHARIHQPNRVSPDGKAIHICGSVGYDCWMTPDGDIYMEVEVLTPTKASMKIDRSLSAQLFALANGSRYWPELASLLPPRPSNAKGCLICKGVGRNQEIGQRAFICCACNGLGWVNADSGAGRGRIS